MAKTIPGSFNEIDQGEMSLGGAPILSDGGGRGWAELNQNQNWLVSERVKNRHVSQWWPGGVWVNQTNVSIREIGSGAWVTRLEFRITPRRHTVRLRIWINCDTDGNNGLARIVTPAGNSGTLTFNAAHGSANEQTATVVVTAGAPPATDLVQVQLDADASAFIDLRWLSIADDPLVLGDMP